MKTVACLIAVAAAACGPAIPRARLADSEPPSRAEVASKRRIHEARCTTSSALFFPGVGQWCQRRNAEAAALSAIAVAEISTATVVAIERDEGLEGLSHPAGALPLLSLQNLWAYGYADSVFEEQRARRLKYVPHDTMDELALAPFNVEVMSQTDVWLGLLVSLGAGIGVSLLVDENIDTDNVGKDPNLFGRTVNRSVGYPAAGAVGIGLFEHVAIGEEALFRGLIQSQMARETNPTEGWVGGSLVFGVAHAPNALALPSEDRLSYLAIGVPFITVLGSYLGLSYRWHDYSLAPPVAIHFWYDLLLSATFFALDPQDSPISARVTLPF